jgi:hypothetical protein
MTCCAMARMTRIASGARHKWCRLDAINPALVGGKTEHNITYSGHNHLHQLETAPAPTQRHKSNMPAVKRVRGDSAVDDETSIVGGNDGARSRLLTPLVYSGSLDKFTHQDCTPVIGREFEGLQVRDLLKWGDDMIRDLAITGMFAL